MLQICRWLTPPGDAAALAAVLGDVVADEAGRRTEAGRLQEEVRASWTVDDAAAAVCRLYRGLLHGGGG